jgi:exo-beta-1,3-glucanase (GH17 family)
VAGVFPSSAQINQDLHQWQGVARRVRMYSVGQTQALIPTLARHNQLQCYAGAWIGADTNANQTEITQLLRVAKIGAPAALVVGAEVLLRGDLTAPALTNLIQQVKAKTRRPVGYADTWAEWLAHPEVAAAVDFLLVHVHPYWENVDVTNAAAYVGQCWQAVQAQYPAKPVLIGETGWPTAGLPQGAAVPGEANLCRFLADFVTLATAQNIPYFLFAAYDETWKSAATGLEVEAHWGLATTNRTLKPCVATLFAAPPPLIEIRQPALCGAATWSSRAISGVVYGLPARSLAGYRVVVYALTDKWYVQPLSVTPRTKLRAGGTWSTKTHRGASYAAVLVTTNYVPSAILYSLPAVGGDVLAVSVAGCAAK